MIQPLSDEEREAFSRAQIAIATLYTNLDGKGINVRLLQTRMMQNTDYIDLMKKLSDEFHDIRKGIYDSELENVENRAYRQNQLVYELTDEDWRYICSETAEDYAKSRINNLILEYDNDASLLISYFENPST